MEENFNHYIDRISSAKLSTRLELFRRLSIAKDFLDSNTDKRIKVEEAAFVASLSTHHFKRAFKELFNITPHQYHVKKRLENSCNLLKKGKGIMKIDDVCYSSGFENSSSFIRLFKVHYGCTPKVFGLRVA